MLTRNVNLETLLALSKIKVSAEDQIPLEGTSFQGTDMVRVTYDMKCGKGYIRRSHPSVPWKAVALAALSKVNDATMKKVLKTALQSPQELEEEHKMRVTKSYQALVDKHEVSVKGRLSGSVMLEGVAEASEFSDAKKAVG